jgi:anthranilate phosphoribosyltransferase
MPRASIKDLRGGDRQRNAEILQGGEGPRPDIVLMNAAAALAVAGTA